MTSLHFESNLQTIMLPLPDQRYKTITENHTQLSEHLQLHLDDLENSYSSANQYCDCGYPFFKLRALFNVAPSILHFEIQTDIINNQTQKIIPSPLITLPTISGLATYKLSSIIYLGGFHFTCRLIINDTIWRYDGRINHGCPQLESLCLPPSLKDLLYLDERPAHIYIFALHHKTT